VADRPGGPWLQGLGRDGAAATLRRPAPDRSPWRMRSCGQNEKIQIAVHRQRTELFPVVIASDPSTNGGRCPSTGRHRRGQQALRLPVHGNGGSNT